MIFEAGQGERTLPIGARLKARRKELGMTLMDLAKKSGMSAPFISQAERNQTTPSIVSLMKLARALDVEIQYFVEVPQAQEVFHYAAKPVPIQVDSPVDYFDLGSALEGRQLDAILMRVPAGHKFPTDQREGEDFLYVVRGTLVAEVGGQSAVLGPGDSMHFDSRVPHSARNETDEDVFLLYVGTPSIFR